MTILPISALVPTRNRPQAFARTLESLSKQSHQPFELIVIDGSETNETKLVCEQLVEKLETQIHYHKAERLGAAIQRNQGFRHITQSALWLLDDDILLEPECLYRLWIALDSDPEVGGVNALITNQKYTPPGKVSQQLFEILSGQKLESFAGKCIGPALNLLPEDRDELPEIVPVEWLNSTCVLYRREALPNPLFPNKFKGYSLMEDVTLSLMVGKNWKLRNARTARIFHDSQPGDHKNNERVLSQMDLVNRHYVMTEILERRQFSDYLKLSLLQLFAIAALFGSQGRVQDLPAVVLGKIAGVWEILTFKKSDLSSQ